MDKRTSCFRGKWKQLYHSASIQLILSVAFTTVAVTGMLFLGVALMLRFSSSSNAMAAESSQRVLAQVNLNLDSYLRNMMRVSDTVYYRVIKNTDLQREDMARELRDALDLLYAKDREVLVSLAVFDGRGSLVSATPLSELKNSVTPSRESWFTTAMERIENLHFSTPHVQNLFDDPDSRYHWVVSLSRHVELSRGGVMQSGHGEQQKLAVVVPQCLHRHHAHQLPAGVAHGLDRHLPPLGLELLRVRPVGVGRGGQIVLLLQARVD